LLDDKQRLNIDFESEVTPHFKNSKDLQMCDEFLNVWLGDLTKTCSFDVKCKFFNKVYDFMLFENLFDHVFKSDKKAEEKKKEKNNHESSEMDVDQLC